MSQTLELLIGTDSILTSNQRMHWARKRDVVSNLRERAGWVAKQLEPITGPVSVTMHVAYPNRSRTRDAHNLAPTLKPILDGIVDAGVLVDDNDEYVRCTSIIADENTSGLARTYRLTIELREA